MAEAPKKGTGKGRQTGRPQTSLARDIIGELFARLPKLITELKAVMEMKPGSADEDRIRGEFREETRKLMDSLDVLRGKLHERDQKEMDSLREIAKDLNNRWKEMGPEELKTARERVELYFSRLATALEQRDAARRAQDAAEVKTEREQMLREVEKRRAALDIRRARFLSQRQRAAETAGLQQQLAQAQMNTPADTPSVAISRSIASGGFGRFALLLFVLVAAVFLVRSWSNEGHEAIHFGRGMTPIREERDHQFRLECVRRAVGCEGITTPTQLVQPVSAVAAPPPVAPAAVTPRIQVYRVEVSDDFQMSSDLLAAKFRSTNASSGATLMSDTVALKWHSMVASPPASAVMRVKLNDVVVEERPVQLVYANDQHWQPLAVEPGSYNVCLAQATGGQELPNSCISFTVVAP